MNCIDVHSSRLELGILPFISHAEIITIATEPDYIDEGITADYLLSKMLYRIEEAMK